MTAPSPALRMLQAKTLQARIAAVRSTLIVAATSAFDKTPVPASVRAAQRLVDRHNRDVRRQRDAAADKAKADIRKVEDMALFGEPTAALRAVEKLEAQAKKAR